MDILKKSLAPITDRAWEEIQEQSQKIFNEYLTARKISDINGPNGLELGAVSTGRLVVPKEHTEKGINYGIREVVPLVEIRKPFTLDIWELDNASRGAKDADFGNMEAAARDIASFEDQCIYYGFKPTSQAGFIDTAGEDPVKINADHDQFLTGISRQISRLKANAV